MRPHLEKIPQFTLPPPHGNPQPAPGTGEMGEVVNLPFSEARWGRDTRPLATLVLALVLLMILVAFSYWISRESEQDALQLVHDRAVVGALHATETHLHQAQAGVHGYIITGEERWLEPYERGLREGPERLAQFRELIVHPAQRDRLPALEATAGQMLDLARELVKVRRDQGFEAARAAIISSDPVGTMNAFHALAVKFEAAQLQLVEVRQAQVARENRRAAWLDAGLGVLTLLVGGGALRGLWRESARRRASETRLHLILEAAPNGMVMVNSTGTIMLANAQLERLFGYPRTEMLGQKIEMLLPERFRAAHPGHRTTFAADPRSRAMGAGRDLFGRRRDGTEFPVEIGLSPLETAGERLIVASVIDISERRQAEEAVREANHELARSNAELTDFASIVSHDLKAPLRAITTVANWLQTDYTEKLDTEGREHLAELVKRAKRLDAMIDGILHYSRLGREEGLMEPVPLTEMLAGVVNDLAPAAPMRVVVPKDLPTVLGDPVRLRQLFQNLVGNALKYGDKPETTVRVEWREQKKERAWEFAVVDNGPGIEARHFERIFKIFQTLAPKDHPNSTGIGLSVVKRIVEQAGGRVWVESTVGAGSTFRFTWPKNPLTQKEWRPLTPERESPRESPTHPTSDMDP